MTLRPSESCTRRRCWASAVWAKEDPYAESGATTLGGKMPVNPSGGLISRGHPIGASGLGQIFELVTQLRHEAGERQVQNCRLALAENGGGNLGFEDAAMGIHILERMG